MRAHSADVIADERKARKRLAALPGFSEGRVGPARLTRLVGMTNQVWKVEADGEALCLRLPGTGAAAMIDRRVEETNARLAAKAGVSPEVLYFGGDGVMLTRFVEGTPLLAAELARREGAIDRVATAFRQLHESGAEFAGEFRAFSTIESYVGILGRLGRQLSKMEESAVANVASIGRALVAHPVTPKPCHCDPTGRNLLDTGQRVWLIDWEYSGMNDPMWDLAYFSIESKLDGVADKRLLTAYYGRDPDKAEKAWMALLKPVAEVQAALWALIQDAEGNRGGDFKGYAAAAFERASVRMAGSELQRQLRILEA